MHVILVLRWRQNFETLTIVVMCVEYMWWVVEKCVEYMCVGLVVKASASRAEDPGFEFRLRRDFFLGQSYQWLPCQAPGIIVSALGLVGPLSVYCDWVR